MKQHGTPQLPLPELRFLFAEAVNANTIETIKKAGEARLLYEL